MQSLCFSHLEEAHQWGQGIDLEEDMCITNKQYTSFIDTVVGNTLSSLHQDHLS